MCNFQVMGIIPDHHIWQRERRAHHGGATRDYSRLLDVDGEVSPKEPGSEPTFCQKCAECKQNEQLIVSQADSETTDSDLTSSPESSCSIKGIHHSYTDIRLPHIFKKYGTYA